MFCCENIGIDHMYYKLHVSNMKGQILPTCLEEKYGYHLGEFSNTFVVFGDYFNGSFLHQDTQAFGGVCAQSLLLCFS